MWPDLEHRNDGHGEIYIWLTSFTIIIAIIIHVTVRTGGISDNGSGFKMFCPIVFTSSIFILQSHQSVLSRTN